MFKPERNMQTTEQTQAIHVIGIALRTSNDEAAQTIPPFWQRFGEQQVPAAITDRIGTDVWAVYTEFAHAGVDNQGSYTLVIGAQVAPDATVPAGMQRAVVPASRRAVFALTPGRPDLVGTAWQRIWAEPLPKTYLADYERYAEDGSILISIGIERAAA